MASVARSKVMLACTECKQRNYNSMKNFINSNNVLKYWG